MFHIVYYWWKGDVLTPAIFKLDDYLKTAGIKVVEGNVSNYIDANARWLFDKVASLRSPRILEIGFNGGHSALIFLLASEDAEVISFDICEHEYSSSAKQYLDKLFPGRHTLICGDSKRTVPGFCEQANSSFDLIFIDGDHSYAGAVADLENCRPLCGKDTLLIMDDVVPDDEEQVRHYNAGPSAAWREWVRNEKVSELELRPVAPGRGFAVGRYVPLPQ